MIIIKQSKEAISNIAYKIINSNDNYSYSIWQKAFDERGVIR